MLVTLEENIKTTNVQNTLQTEMYIHYISTHTNFAFLQFEK